MFSATHVARSVFLSDLDGGADDGAKGKPTFGIDVDYSRTNCCPSAVEEPQCNHLMQSSCLASAAGI